MKSIPAIEKLFAEEEDHRPYKYRRPYFTKKDPEVIVKEAPEVPLMDESYLQMEYEIMVQQMAGSLKAISEKRKTAPKICKDTKIIGEVMLNAGALARARRGK